MTAPRTATATPGVGRATADDAPELATLVGELLAEIMAAIGEAAFHFDAADTTARLRAWLASGVYAAFVARAQGGAAAGLITLSETHALYAEGPLGIVCELYVRPTHRGAGWGEALIAQARVHAAARGWRRLEVTTPPLPAFERTLAFYQRMGFAISGGRKLKTEL